MKLVPPTGYGFDDTLLLKALDAFGPSSARGVVVVPADESDAGLQRLHDRGVRGIRCMLLSGASGLLP